MEKIFNKVFNKTVKSSEIHEAVLYVENSEGDFKEHYSYGGKKIDTPMIAASVTKLFTTACILKLYEQGTLLLNDKISSYLDNELLRGLHLFKGRDYSFDLTISNLLYQTSGLPDEFESSSNSVTLKRYLEEDIEFGLETVVNTTKTLKPHFAPEGRRAYYSNINFDLLGKIIENVTGEPLAEVFKIFVFQPLGMKNTYLPTDDKDFVPVIYYKNIKLERPKLIASCGASGGCVTTPNDLMLFSKGFWKGKLFDGKILNQLAEYRKLQFSKGPITYGGGYMRINVGGLLTMFMGKGELLGHSGSTGSFAFYYPYKDLYIVGDLNQMANPALPIRLLLKLAMEAKNI